MTESMDIYCERLDAGFWSEPLNALTNASFILAALYGLFLALRLKRLNGQTGLLIALAALIGIGSFGFHTLATRLASYGDIVPIWTFVLIYILLSLRLYLGMSWLRVAVTMIIVALVGAAIVYLLPAGTENNASLFNGSEQYAPAVLGLIVFAVALSRARHAAAPYLWAGLVVFAISLTFRTLDQAVCATFPLGTHFGWHLMNGLLIGILLAAMVRHGGMPKGTSRTTTT